MTAPICLLTRPEAQSRDLAADLSGVELVISPILQIVGLPADPAKLAAAPGFVFTSANALPFAGAAAGRPALCVGPQTAAAARASGFDVTEGPGDAWGCCRFWAAGARTGCIFTAGTGRAVCRLPVLPFMTSRRSRFPIPPARYLPIAARLFCPFFQHEARNCCP